MSLETKYSLNMPQLLWGGLNENWLLKELGDLHWQQITDALNTPSDQLTDSRGERLYASFVRVHWSGSSTHSFGENEVLSFTSALSRYGSKMFFSDTTGSGASGKLSARLLSVFSTRKDSDNTQLAKGNLRGGIKSKKVKAHKKLPELAQEYLTGKSLLFDAQGKVKPEAQPETLYRRAYTIDAYDDINGVGLLYFASYPKISDKCERLYMHEYYMLEQDWLQSAGVVARDIHYYGNANADEVLVYELNALEQQDRRLTLRSSLYRSVDGKLIARMTTTKGLAEGIVLKKRSTSQEHTVVETVTESSSVKATPSTESGLLPPPAAVSKGGSVTNVGYDQAALNQIVIDFLGSMLEVSDLTPQSDLHALGIESVVYQELSEHLFDKHQLPNNPSRFYGTSTIAALTNDLLKSLSEGQSSSSPAVPQEKPAVSTIVPSTTSSEAIAIIGMSGRFPGSPDVETFWEHLKSGKDLITEVPKDRWDWEDYCGDPQQEQGKTRSKWGGFMEGIDAFDPLFFGISPHEAMLMDPQQRLTLEAVWHALEDAGIAPHQLKGSDAGVFMGVSGSDYAQLLQTAGKSTEVYDVLGSVASMLANRVSYFLDVHGPSQVIDTACSSSLVAVHEAVRNLKDGSCSLALAGGVHVMLNPKLTLAYSQAGMLSEDGRCKAFDQRADGYVRSEGIGVVILKRLTDAQRDGDRIYGVIRGSAVNHGGQANTLTAPNPEAQKALLVAAYQSGDVDPARVSYLEAHGTGTSLGDPIEIEGIKEAFKELYKNKGTQLPTDKRTTIGSVKTNVGHLEAAAGITGLIKVLLSMEHKLLPGNVHLQDQNSYIDLADTPFELQREKTSWEAKEDQPRVAGVSSFGSGGANAHVVIEEYREASGIENEALKMEGPFIVLLSARNEERLEEVVQNLSNYLEGALKSEQFQLQDLAYTLQVGREAMETRLAMVVNDLEELRTQLANYQNEDIKDLLIGNIKEDKSDFLLEGEAGEAYIQTAIAKKQSKALAQLWVKGVEIDWNLLYDQAHRPYKIRLPTYPFVRERYWLAQSTFSHHDLSVAHSATSIQNFITDQIALLSNIAVVELDKDELIMDYDIDSVKMTHLATSINTSLGLTIRPLDLQSYLTITELTDFIYKEWKAKPATREVKVGESKDQGIDTSLIAEAVAIVGVDVELSGARTLDELAGLLEAGLYEVASFPQRRWDDLPAHYTKGFNRQKYRGKFLNDIATFDHKLFKISVREAMLMDPQQRLLLQSVWRCIENAGYTKTVFSQRPTDVFVALNGVDYADVVKYDAQIDEFSGRGVKRYIAANRLSNFFNLKGQSEVIDTACSSFFVGVKKAIDSLRSGKCAQAIVSGVQANLLPFVFEEQLAQGLLTNKERTLPFDASAAGYVRSEGVVSIVLKRKSTAEEEGDHVYALLKGAGLAHGGSSLNITAPNVASHTQAMEGALADSGVAIGDLLAIESHGTGMPLGDESEIKAFSEVFERRGVAKEHTCIIGAAKGLFGHLEAASGGLALLKSIISLRLGKMHGIRGLEQLHPGCQRPPFVISAHDQPLQAVKGSERMMGLHSYGIGGVSSFLILQHETTEQPLEWEGEVKKIFVLSALSEYTLRCYVDAVLTYLTHAARKPGFDYAHFLASYQMHREVMKTRLAVVANDVAALTTRLEDFRNDVPTSSLYVTSSVAVNPPKAAAALQKQAAQWVRSGEGAWGVHSLSKFPYPGYPMDRRKSFWISQGDERPHSGLTPHLPSTRSKKSKYVMLDI